VNIIITETQVRNKISNVTKEDSDELSVVPLLQLQGFQFLHQELTILKEFT
jgi:hypothetical protein